MATFHKPSKMKYTDMAIYIDAHLKDIVEADVNWEIEAKVYEYIYHIIYALSYKAGFFTNMSYYDEFALYGASELYMSMRRKQSNAGQTVKGKIVKPIKSSLNYIKSVLYPLKVNFQRQNFGTVINPALENQDTAELEASLKESIQQQYSKPKKECFEQAVRQFPNLIEKVVKSTPFRDDPLISKRIYISVQLTLLYEVTLPTKFKKKMDKKPEWNSKDLKKYINAFRVNQDKAILWHIDENWDNYIKLLVVKVKKEFSKELEYYMHADELTEEELNNILKSAYGLSQMTNNLEGDN